MDIIPECFRASMQDHGHANMKILILLLFLVISTRLYTKIQHHKYLTDNSGVIDNKREICQCNETR
jgi:hypothetical protein